MPADEYKGFDPDKLLRCIENEHFSVVTGDGQTEAVTNSRSH